MFSSGLVSHTSIATMARALDELAASIERGYQAIPETLRRDVEYSIRREQRARDSMTIDR